LATAEESIKNNTLNLRASQGEIASVNSLGFQGQIEDLHLKSRIPEENPKNNISARSHYQI